MQSGRARFGVFACALMTAGVVANILTQGPSHLRLNKMTPGTALVAPPQAAPAVTPDIPASRVGRDGRPIETEGTPTDLVRAIQRELQARGYDPGAQDGVAGVVTRAAIMAFEEDHKLPVTADPSDALLKTILLGGAGALRPLQPSGQTTGQTAGTEMVLKAVHQSLAALGYIGRRTDAKFGPELTRALREFEMDQGLNPTGRVTAPTVARLLKATMNRRPR